VNSPVFPSLLVDDTRFFLSHPEGQPQSGYVKGTADSPKILVIDDEAAIADTLTEILAGSGFDALAFYGGESAIEFARKHCPDIVLSDIVMPKLNGVETVIAIRELCPTTHILLLSGQAGIADILQHARARGYEFELIPKPVHPDALLKRLSEFR
jgi:CheY-like chemotaxis protein